MVTNTQEFTSHTDIEALLERMHEIADLTALADLADWDQHTALPEKAVGVRGAQQATIQGILHERWSDSQLGLLLDRLSTQVNQAAFSDADRGLVREARREYDRATKLPRQLVEEMARMKATSLEAWLNARAQNDFAIFAPMLERTVALQREMADHIGYTETCYDALLDLFEPGLTVKKIEALFTPLRETSVALLQRIQASGTQVDASCLEGHFPVPEQLQLCDKVLRGMGYDFSRGQRAQSAHPFTTHFGSPFDVRLTVRTKEHALGEVLMAAMHEGGHAIYEQGIAPALVRTPLASGASMGIHESQSRLWENALGRSEAFWRHQFSQVREAFPAHFAQVDVATFVRALNKVEVGPVRIGSDEVTYNLHIIVRFELEKALFNGDMSVASLPGRWNALYREYLGVEPINDLEGVLQDSHWTHSFGYFPTYTLGNLYAAQIFFFLRKAFPDFEQRLTHEGPGFVRTWLRERLHTFGATYLPEELIIRATGEPFQATYFERYLLEKFEAIYG